MGNLTVHFSAIFFLIFPQYLGVTVPVENVRRRGHWIKEFWTCSGIDEIQVCFYFVLQLNVILRNKSSQFCNQINYY